MARELGLNPRGFGKLSNRAREPWKQPLPQFIEQLYYKRFGRTRPEAVVPLEKREQQERAEKAARRSLKAHAGQPGNEGGGAAQIQRMRRRARRGRTREGQPADLPYRMVRHELLFTHSPEAERILDETVTISSGAGAHLRQEKGSGASRPVWGR